VEWGVYGGDDGWSEDEDLGRNPFLPCRIQAGREKGEEGLNSYDRVQKMGVEDIGEPAWWDSSDRRGLIVESRYEEDGFER
jgi:hypothetical protein